MFAGALIAKEKLGRLSGVGFHMPRRLGEVVVLSAAMDS